MAQTWPWAFPALVRQISDSTAATILCPVNSKPPEKHCKGYITANYIHRFQPHMRQAVLNVSRAFHPTYSIGVCRETKRRAQTTHLSTENSTNIRQTPKAVSAHGLGLQVAEWGAKQQSFPVPWAVSGVALQSCTSRGLSSVSSEPFLWRSLWTEISQP